MCRRKKYENNQILLSGTIGLHSELFHLLLLQHRYPQSFLRIDQRSIQSKNINFGFKNVKSHKKTDYFNFYWCLTVIIYSVLFLDKFKCFFCNGLYLLKVFLGRKLSLPILFTRLFTRRWLRNLTRKTCWLAWRASTFHSSAMLAICWER